MTDHHQIHKFHDVDEFGMWTAYALVHPVACSSLIPMLVTDPSTERNAIDLATGEEVCEYKAAFDDGSLEGILALLTEASNGFYSFRLVSTIVLSDGTVDREWELV